MPIYRVDRKISSVYRGDKKIIKIYRGDRQVYSAGGIRRVKLFGNVYKAIYVEGSALSSLSFNATPNFDPTLRKYEFTYDGDLGTILLTQSLKTTYIGNGNIRLGENRNLINLPANQKVDVIFDKDKLYIDNVFVSTLSIGNKLDTATTQKLRINNDVEFYEMKIYDNDVLVYHFVPAYIIVNDVEKYGIAELISEEFVSNDNLRGEPEYESE